MKTNPMQWVRWLARGIGLVASGIFLFAAGVSGMSSTPMPPLLFILLMLAIAGVLIALRWEKIGGAMTIGASVGLVFTSTSMLDVTNLWLRQFIVSLS